jgi:hydantoinase/carbamoylase family amidase
MGDRRDALAGAAQVITSMETLANEMNREVDHTVITVGRVAVEPNAVNVVPGRATLTVDFRSPSDALLEKGEERMRAEISEIAADRGLDLEFSCTERQPVVPLDRGVCDMLREAARRLDVRLVDAASGALHDTAILAPLLPSAMLFVASRDGISHNPAEFSRIEHIALAARIVVEAVHA